MKKIYKRIFPFLFFIINISVFSQDNHIGLGILMKSSTYQSDKGLGLNVFYNRNIIQTISIKAFFQSSFSSDKYLTGITSYGIDLNYWPTNDLYTGFGINYNVFYEDLKGNTDTSIPFRFINHRFNNSFGLNLSLGFNIPLTNIFSLNFESKYNFLRPNYIMEIIKLDNTVEVDTTRKILDNFHLSIGFIINF
jgi:hypothetical protein